MKQPANRPPSDITPAQFFTEWLPLEFAAEFGPGKREAADITVAVKLEGEQGGHWVLDVRDGKLLVRSPENSAPLPQVTLTQEVRDWRAVAVGEEGAPPLAPPHASPTDVLFVDPASRQIMQSVKGTMRFEVTGFHGRTWWMQVKFGSQPQSVEPDATMCVDAETYRKMLNKELAPPEAYFSGKVQMRGNTALAMQLAMAMLPRFTS